MENLSDTQTKVLHALHQAANATARQLADTTGLAYSTVTRLLRELADLGLAAKNDNADNNDSNGGDRGLSVRPGTKEPTVWHATTAEQATTTTPPAKQTGADPQEDTEPADAEDARHPEQADAVAGHAQPDVTAEVADAEPHGTGADQPGDGAEKTATATPAPEQAADAAADAEADHADAADDQPSSVTDAAPRPARLGKGQLREQVLAVLRDHAGQELGPTQIAKQLPGRSLGAIANACDRLVADKHAQLANEKPRRYTATD